MSTIARRILASPVRLSSDVWTDITGLVARNDATATAEFEKVTGVASSLINDEVLAKYPMIVKNKGPRLRIYCLYGEDAISGDDKNEDRLSWEPTAEEWHSFLPCSEEEFEEMNRILKTKSKKFTVYNVEKGLPDDEPVDAASSASSKDTSVNWDAFGKL